MQRLSIESLKRVSAFVEDATNKMVVSGSIIQIGIAKDDEGNFLVGKDLINWVLELVWKAKMFDEMNKGFSAIDKKTGEKIGPFATQWELGNKLNKSSVVMSRYYTGAMVSKTYKFIKDDYYTFTESFINPLLDPNEKYTKHQL